jgi:YhcH/YjgK/YiaL family protein
MVIDQLSNADKYYALGAGIQQALVFLEQKEWLNWEEGKYPIVDDQVFAIIQSYHTKDPLTEKLESHRKFIDVQYVVSGVERMGHAILQEHIPSRPYNPEDDYMLFDEQPDFFRVVREGMFTIFYPTDLHMPCIQLEQSMHVKKIVIKVAVTY